MAYSFGKNEMTDSDTHLRYSPKGLGKIIRHSGAVYPLEAYGFLLGEPQSSTIVTALPVGKTTKWYDFSDRFSRIEEGHDIAHDVARAFELEVIGVYHSYYGYRCDSPIFDVPEKFRDGVVCIKEVSGGDLDLWPYGFYVAGREVLAGKLVLPNSPMRNPRRIHSSWVARWGAIDYSNGYEEQEAEH
jgi:proteasome lid subunit RPN8/RPN11